MKTIWFLVLFLTSCSILKVRSYANIHFPYHLSNKYLLGAGPYNPFKGKYRYLYKSFSVPGFKTNQYYHSFKPYSSFEERITKDFCLPDDKKFNILKIGFVRFLVCYEQPEKNINNECICVGYLELTDIANFRKQLKEFSACPEKVDELIVDIDSE